MTLVDLVRDLEDITNCTEQEQIELLKKNPLFPFKDLYKFSETVQIEAVKQNWKVIYRLKKPSEQVIYEAVKQNWEVIHYITRTLSIKTVNEETQLIAVKQDWRAIYYIDNPSEETQLIAVKQDWKAIYYINNPSKKVLKEAKKHGYKAIEYIKFKKMEKILKTSSAFLEFFALFLGFFALFLGFFVVFNISVDKLWNKEPTFKLIKINGTMDKALSNK